MYNITLKHILFLNKNDSVNEKVQSILEANQLTVVNIQRFCEAIAYLTEGRAPQPDLVLLDLDLLEVSGASAVEQLQAIAPDMPIIALVSPQQEEMANGLFAVGLQDYLLKDEINRRTLMRVIAGAVSRSRYVKARCSERIESDRLEKISAAFGNDFFQKAPTGMAILDPLGVIIRVNPALAKMNGRSRQDFVSKKITAIWPENAHQLMGQFEKVWQTNQSIIDREFTMNQPGSSTLTHQSWSMFPLADADGETIAIGCLILDISDRKQAAEAISQERQQLRQIVAHAPVAIAILDRELRYLAYSKKWLTTYGLVGQEIVGRRHDQIFPDMPDRWRKNYQKALQGEIISIPEECWKRQNGKKVYLRRAIHPWYSPNGEVGGIVIASERIDALVEAREQALAAVRSKSLFLANMSHEIRTPMNGVLAMSDLLLKTPLNAEQFDFVQTLKVTSHHLLTIINDLLDFSKLESAQMRLELRKFDLNECLESVINLLSNQANAKGIQITVLVDADVPRQLVGDDLRLRQILTNLIGNAIKFTESGEVIIYVKRLENLTEKKNQKRSKAIANFSSPNLINIKFSIKDTGTGISPPDQKKLFQVFSQVHQASIKYGGTGLGLAICKQFVQMMGGKIGVKSKLGEGSTFWFTTKLGLASGTMDLPSLISEIRSEKTIELEATRNALSGKKILVIDQNATHRTAVSLAAQSWGMQIEETDNGVAALTHLCSVTAQQKFYDAVLIDLQMLKMDRDFCSQLMRIKPALNQIQLILMTSIAEKEQAKKIVNLTFADYVVKPIE